MNPPDDSALLHGMERYDPQKAHEYYLRTRQLKGKHPGGAQVIPLHGRTKTGAVVLTPHHKSAKQLQNEAKVRTAALHQRLDRLKSVLALLVKQAKERSGVKVSDSRSPAQRQKEAKGKSPHEHTHQTAAEKRKAHEDYLKNKAKHPTKTDHQLHMQIKEVEAKIAKVRAELQTAIEQARKHAQSQSKTASKGR
jgi:hypothetical protein